MRAILPSRARRLWEAINRATVASLTTEFRSELE